MQSSSFLRHGASMLIAVACLVTIMAAHRMGSSESPARRGLDTGTDLGTDETTGSIGPLRSSRSELTLTEEQRARIYERVTGVPDAPAAHIGAPDVSQHLPQGVPLEDLPAGLGREIPEVRGHKLVKLDDRILLINPADRTVAAMIPRYKLLP
ncbi:MAG: hypothetical protein ACJ8F3_18610 [Xanthobacteraceae bacterium]